LEWIFFKLTSAHPNPFLSFSPRRLAACLAAAARHLKYDTIYAMNSAGSEEAVEKRVRLHITPFNPQLADKILAPSVKPLASNISFHAVQTFPERGFGYVELPEMEARKLRQKLNGSTLKGAKVRIEEAKPERKRKIEVGDEDEEDSKIHKKVKKEKRRRENGVLPGHELEEGRRVKRGWTDGDTKKGSDRKEKKRASKANTADEHGEGRRLRFKATVPPNVASLPTTSKEKSKKKGKDGKNDKRSVVQEFDKTKKSMDVVMDDGQGSHGAATYEDGKGWVDADGVVVEAERPSKRPKRRVRLEDQHVEEPPEEDRNMEDVGSPNVEEPAPVAEDGPELRRPTNASFEVADEEVPPQNGNEVHPLEALFKRPTTRQTKAGKARPKAIDTSFSFFDESGAGDDEDGPADMPPQTPHTRRDMEGRSIRSAAPTPDTAAIGRKFSFPFAQANAESEDEFDEDQDAEMRDAEQPATGGAQVNGEERGEESALRKRFYDSRGDFNRGWKRLRREGKKQKRQRENRRLSQKVA
jgi:hypothetical protein